MAETCVYASLMPDSEPGSGLEQLAVWLRRHGPLGPESAQPTIVRSCLGSWVEALDGKRYLDFSVGGMMPLGYNHPVVLSSAKEAEHLPVHSGLELPVRIQLMRKLAEVVTGGMNRRVQLCDSGREALAQALKLAGSVTGRNQVIYLAAQPDDDPGFRADTAAVVVHPFDRRLGQASEFCRESEALLIDDESLVGPGMSGRVFAVELSQVRPDVYVLGSGLAAGLPLGACITGRSTLRWTRAAEGGNPTGCTVALEYLRMLEGGLLESIEGLGRKLLEGVSTLVTAGLVEPPVGAGLVLTLRFGSNDLASGFVRGCRERGLFLARVGETAVGIRPPATAGVSEVELAVDVMRRILRQMVKR